MTQAKTNNQKEIWFLFQNNSLIIEKANDNPILPTTIVDHLKNAFHRKHILEINEMEVIYLAELNSNEPLPSHLTLISLRKGFEILQQTRFKTLAKAYGILNWDKNHAFCGRCGQATQLKVTSFERYCENCSLLFYPRISPSVIILIYRGDELLMARSPHFSKGFYSLIAGFVETGESIEEAVHREVKEEVNITIKNLSYFGSQPWPFPDSLMIAFIAEYESGEIIPDPVEIEAVNWYHYTNLPNGPSSTLSIAKKLIDYFVENKRKGTWKHGKV